MSSGSYDVVLTRKRIKQLENQNLKLKRLLDTATEICHEDSSNISTLKDETTCLQQTFNSLEKKKDDLERNFNMVLQENDELSKTLQDLENEHICLKTKLGDILNEIDNSNMKIEYLKSEDSAQFKLKLENEKSKLLEQILIMEQNKNYLSQQNLVLENQLFLLETAKKISPKTSKTEDVKQMSSHEAILATFKYLEKTYNDYIGALEEHSSLPFKLSKQEIKNEELINITEDSNNVKSQIELNQAIVHSNTNILNKLKEVKSKLETSLKQNSPAVKPEQKQMYDNIMDMTISEMENQKDRLFDELEKSLENSSNEISCLREQLSDPEIKRLVNEIEIQKTVLLYNLKMLKLRGANSKSDEGLVLPEVPGSNSTTLPTIPTTSALEIRAANLLKESDSTGVINDGEFQASTSRADNHKLEDIVAKLENKKKVLLQQLHSLTETSAQRFEELEQQIQIELHTTFMREQSSHVMAITKNFDDATNHLYAGEDAGLRQRIRELEMENDRIRMELENIMERIRNERAVLNLNQVQVAEVLKERIDELENKTVVNK